MTKLAAAFRATYSDLKIVKTRQVVQLCFELPLADFPQAYDVLGGLPNPASDSWFAIAPLAASAAQPAGDQSKRTSARRRWHELSAPQQAGIRCEEPAFAVFLSEEFPEEWHEAMNDPAECVRLICRVQSRAELHDNAEAWRVLNDKFDAWKTLEHA